MSDVHPAYWKRDQRTPAIARGVRWPIGAARCVTFSMLVAMAGVGCAEIDRFGLRTNAAEVVPLTPAMVDQMGILAFHIYLTTHKRAETPDQTALLERVKGKFLEAVAHSEFAARASHLDWEIVVVKGDSPDAMAFPGGKVIVQSALLQTQRTGALKLPPEQRLAVVLGHELVHPLAGHMAQRIDKELREALALAMEGKGLADARLDPATTATLMTAMGVEYEANVIRPFTSKQESEADHKGLLLTAQAGYDPKVAVVFWQQIQQLAHGAEPVEILTLHPSYDTRIGQLNDWMAEARQLYLPTAATTSARMSPS